MKILGTIFITSLSFLGLAFVITVTVGYFRENIPITKSFTYDFVDSVNRDLDFKINAFKDSSMSNVNNPPKYNQYLDSAIKYGSIHQYINSKIK